MESRSEWCIGCRRLLVVPPRAKNIRCAICGAVTAVHPRDPVRKAKKWMKGLISQFSYNVNQPFPSSASHMWGSPPSPDENCPIRRPLDYPSVYGNKRALLIGITYKGRRYELKGTVNDVKCMKYLLQKNGFPDECILLLSDEETDPYRIPTRQNMIAAMRWLVQGCKQGDSLVFHFSGHGTQQRDTDGDEVDGYDETLCPVDYETNGMIVDDEINSIIVRPLTTGVKLHAVIDSCHSGTVLDLPYLYRMNRMGHCQWENHTPPNGVYKGTSGGLAISFSGCDDHQTSADTTALAGLTTTGAMTYAFIQAVENEPGATYGSLLLAMRSAIRDAGTGVRINGPIASLMKRVFNTGLTQEPQLCSSETFDVFRRPFLL